MQETIKHIEVTIIDDNVWEPDEIFFVKLSLENADDDLVKLGSKTIMQVTIINDDGKYFNSYYIYHF